jgi:hypothetical protein
MYQQPPPSTQAYGQPPGAVPSLDPNKRQKLNAGGAAPAGPYQHAPAGAAAAYQQHPAAYASQPYTAHAAPYPSNAYPMGQGQAPMYGASAALSASAPASAAASASSSSYYAAAAPTWPAPIPKNSAAAAAGKPDTPHSASRLSPEADHFLCLWLASAAAALAEKKEHDKDLAEAEQVPALLESLKDYESTVRLPSPFIQRMIPRHLSVP